jgi:diguanylate cyclase (GGDEF)-like protein
VADALVSTGIAGLAFAAVAAPRRASRPVGGTNRGLLVPVIFGALALGVLAVGQPLHFNPVATGLACAALALVLARTAAALLENSALLAASRSEAVTDALTGLNNRRKLQVDLEGVMRGGEPHALIMFDLNGFKSYNDAFGHGAGDLLLKRLGKALADTVDEIGSAYRMGGDEFCILASLGVDVGELSGRCADALSSYGNGFAITAAHGAVIVPDEGLDVSSALALVDARMYSHKRSGRPATAQQAAGVLLAVVAERAPELSSHSGAVGDLACAVGAALGIEGAGLDALRTAAELHDIGKMAIPESILEKPGPLSDDEWLLVRQHTIIGERIMSAAPALVFSAALVRSSHENFDGTGYPDRLRGTDIPLGARIISVVDAFDAMVSVRSYGKVRTEAEALAELQRCAGSQFDPAVVDAFGKCVSKLAKAAQS